MTLKGERENCLRENMDKYEYDIIQTGFMLVFIIFSLGIVTFLIIITSANAQLTNEITKSGISVKLLENTNFCDYDCHSVYRICSNTTTILSKDVSFTFSKQLQQKETIALSNKDLSNCYDLRIDGKKGLFDNVDNIPNIKGIEFKEFAWWNTSFLFRYNIDDSNITTNGSVFYLNGIWIKKGETKYKYCDTVNCNNSVVFGNETDKIPYEIENNTNIGIGYLVSSVWNDIGLEHLYHLKNVSGNYIDSKGSADLTKSGNIKEVDGTFNQSVLILNPASSMLKSSAFDGTFGNTAFTMLIFAKIHSIPVNQPNRIYEFGTENPYGTNRMVYIGINETTNPYFIFGAWATDIVSNQSITLNQEYCLAMKYNGTDIIGYVNGSVVSIGSLTLNLQSSSYIFMGAGDWPGSPNNVLNETVDEARLYSRELTNNEILDYCNSRFVTLNNTSENLTYINFQFNILDSFTNTNLNNVNLSCNGFSTSGNSPLSYIFTNLTATYNCNVSSPFYYNSTFSFIPTEYTKTIYLDRIGLTTQEHLWLKTTMFLQSVQGMDIYPTNKTCINNNTALKQVYQQEICLDSSCNNFTIKQEVIPCYYGCITDINKFSAECQEPNWVIYLILIIFIIGIFALAGYLWKR